MFDALFESDDNAVEDDESDDECESDMINNQSNLTLKYTKIKIYMTQLELMV